METALGGREIVLADAPNPRSPIHGRAAELQGRMLERAEARGKHLLAHFSDGLALHSHLGMNGRWRISRRRASALRQALAPALVGPRRRGAVGRADPAAGVRVPAAQRPRARAARAPTRSRPASTSKPQRPGCARRAAGWRSARRCSTSRSWRGSATRSGTAACGPRGSARGAGSATSTRPRSSERSTTVARIMEIAVERGRRPESIYRAERRGCPRCGGPVSVRGQGDANRTSYWCPTCQT